MSGLDIRYINVLEAQVWLLVGAPEERATLRDWHKIILEIFGNLFPCIFFQNYFPTRFPPTVKSGFVNSILIALRLNVPNLACAHRRTNQLFFVLHPPENTLV